VQSAAAGPWSNGRSEVAAKPIILARTVMVWPPRIRSSREATYPLPEAQLRPLFNAMCASAFGCGAETVDYLHLARARPRALNHDANTVPPHQPATIMRRARKCFRVVYGRCRGELNLISLIMDDAARLEGLQPQLAAVVATGRQPAWPP